MTRTLNSDTTAEVLCRLASDTRHAKMHLSADEVEGLIAALPEWTGDFERLSCAWRIILRQLIVDARLLDIASKAVSSYRPNSKSTGYEDGVDLQLMYLLGHGNPSAELIDGLAQMPVGRIREVIAEHFLAGEDIDRGFRLLIDAIPYAEHATLNGIGMWLADLATADRREEVRK